MLLLIQVFFLSLFRGFSFFSQCFNRWLYLYGMLCVFALPMWHVHCPYKIEVRFSVVHAFSVEMRPKAIPSVNIFINVMNVAYGASHTLLF